ncbi:phospholipase D family protein [Sulfurimicrobium lacus]|uniref:Phospholipase D family protein n=1 Tax=Sulfurimicrobium lacus TaxID=2715678 RepID=A0A6F8V8B5_9PROT|nr:phospholipase D family protein [Sulfurimicrobium lacus]BCB25928.1 phospholipase D family protein [Sulfurimicrobium lacus]
MKRSLVAVLFSLCMWLPLSGRAALDTPMAFIVGQIDAHARQSGIYVLNTGMEALLARAWLADHAQHSIEVQYFIWSADNIGMLAAEALLRAADRGVRVRVIVDDLLIDAPDKSLLALAKHPNIDIRIYNPQHSVGTPFHKRALNVLTNFRGVNQRMHDKTFIVDGKLAITGGRNMANEYFDYNHEYNFRDRDALLLGEVVKTMKTSFENFWGSELSVPVEALYDGLGLMQKNVRVDDEEIKRIYRELHEYANSPDNFAPEVRSAIEAAPASFARLSEEVVWADVKFISDRPGKNKKSISLGGGGLTTTALAQLIRGARDHIVIQSPYLVLSDKAMTLFREATARGVRVRINTNSLASTDNLQAFSGYRNQRAALLKIGLEIYEYKPDPKVQGPMPPVMTDGKRPVFALHAKTMVVDSKIVYIGTFNVDPRSENLNTEVGVIVQNEGVAHAVEAAIETDMQPGNSWNAATDQPDQYVPLDKRSKARFWQTMPIKPLL